MADHSKPLATSTYANFVSELNARLNDITLGLNSDTTTPTNVPTNAIRFNGSAGKWQKWSGSAWADLAATYAISISGNAGTVTNGVVTTGTYADPAWISSLAGSKITGDVGGNAATATKLATARNINGVSFDGTAAISVNTVQALTINGLGSGDTSFTFNGGTARTLSYNSVGAPKADGTGASGTWAISISGNAATATALGSTLGLGGGGTGATTAAAALVNLGVRSSATGSLFVPVGTTAQRDAAPSVGMLRYNTTTSQFEGYAGTAWGSIGGGAGGSGNFYENSTTISADYTITTGKNAMTAGPVAIDNGVTVTIPNGSNWVIT
jgi:hypothetical protein